MLAAEKKPAAKKLTKSVVDAVTPSAKPLYLWDAGLTGFGVKITPAGSRVAIYQYRYDGKTRVFTIGKLSDALTLEQARDVAKDAAASLRSGVDPQAVKFARREAMTVGDLLDVYFTSAAFAEKSESTKIVDLPRAENHIRPLLGKSTADRVTHDAVGKMRDAITAGKTAVNEKTVKLRGRRIVRGGEGAAGQAVTLLATIYSWAISEKLLTENPAANVSVYKPKSREAIIAVDEYSAVFDAIDKLEQELRITSPAADAVRLIAFTGARLGEIKNLIWQYVEFNTNRIALPPKAHKTGKRSGKPRLIFLPPEAVDILKRQKRRKPDEFVFASTCPGAPLDLGRVWPKIRNEAGLSNEVVLHSLRHSVGSHLAMSGAGMAQIQQTLGHKQISTSQRYIHFAEAAQSALAATAAAPISAGYKNKGKAK